MSEWRLETAELSDVVRQARAHGPQTITLRGEQAAVVLSMETYLQLRSRLQTAGSGEEPVGVGLAPGDPAKLNGSPPGETWIDRLREGVLGDIDIQRDKDTGRDFEL